MIKCRALSTTIQGLSVNGIHVLLGSFRWLSACSMLLQFSNHLFWETELHIIQDSTVLIMSCILLFADKQAGGGISSDTLISALRRTDRTVVLCAVTAVETPHETIPPLYRTARNNRAYFHARSKDFNFCSRWLSLNSFLS